MATTPRLTAMRNSLWDSIENYAPLQDVFKRKFRLEGKDALQMALLNPSMADMPAIAIQALSGSSPWDTNSMMRFSYSCEIGLWTPHWDLELGEKLIEWIVRSFEQSKPSGSSRSYVWAACSNFIVGDFRRTPIPPAENEISKTLWVLGITLQKQWGPGTETWDLE